MRVVNIHEPCDLFEIALDPTPEWRELKTQHESALVAFEAGDFLTATRILGNLLASHPQDGPVMLLLARAVEAMSDASRNFDSIWDLDRK